MLLGYSLLLSGNKYNYSVYSREKFGSWKLLAFSSVSSAVNSLSAVVLEDFIKPIYTIVKKDDKEGMSERTATRISKALCT